MLAGAVLACVLCHHRARIPSLTQSMNESLFIHFSQIDETGSTYWGLVMTGVFGTLMASAMPFDVLTELISGGILLSFVLSNAALLVLRVEERDEELRRGRPYYQALTPISTSDSSGGFATESTTTAQLSNGTGRGEARDARYAVALFVVLSGVTAYAFALDISGPLLTFAGTVLCSVALILPFLSPRWLPLWAAKRLVAAELVGAVDGCGPFETDDDDDDDDNDDIHDKGDVIGGGRSIQGEMGRGHLSRSGLDDDVEAAARLDHTQTTAAADAFGKGNNNNNGNSNAENSSASLRTETFRVPLGPTIPGIAIGLNWYLLAQMSASGTLMMYALVGLSCVSYFVYGAKHSIGARTNSWTSETPVHSARTTAAATTSPSALEFGAGKLGAWGWGRVVCLRAWLLSRVAVLGSKTK
jgi:hypothetical protein